MYQHFSIYLEIYDFTVHFCIGDKQKSLNFINKSFQLPDSKEGIPAFTLADMEAKGLRFKRIGYIPIIWLPHFPKTPMEIGTLSHEIFHVVCDVFNRWTDIPLSSDSEEAYCHLIAYITRKFWEKVK